MNRRCTFLYVNINKQVEFLFMTVCQSIITRVVQQFRLVPILQAYNQIFNNQFSHPQTIIHCLVRINMTSTIYTHSITKHVHDIHIRNLIYYRRKGTLECITINLIGREGFRGANKNTECIHDSQWEGFILLLANQKV